MKAPSRALLWTGYLGNLFEHYDTALFGFLSPFLASVMFPEKDPLTALILTYAILPLGMLARPIGSLLFGYIGDVYGRNRALFYTLFGMSAVSACIACIPSYQQIGLWAPLLFCLARALQNFFAAGETMGGAIFLLENSSESRRDLISGLYNSSTMAGHLLASFAVVVLSHSNYVDPGWRFLYVCGCITALFGSLIRRSSFTLNVSSQVPKKSISFRSIFWTYKKPLFYIVIASGFGSASYSIALILMNGFIPFISPFSKAELMVVNSYLLILDLCCLPLFGWIASKVSREKLMISASLAVALFSLPLFMSLKGATFLTIIGVRMALVILGVAFFAPFHAWAQKLVHPDHRYIIVSLGYALGTQLLGSPASAIALWCFKQTGNVSSPAWYWILLSLASSTVLLLSMRSKQPVYNSNELNGHANRFQ